MPTHRTTWLIVLALAAPFVLMAGALDCVHAESAVESQPPANSGSTAASEAATGVERGQTGDPLERLNRGTFWLNDQLDNYVLEPVARGWDFAIPKPAQTAIWHFFQNLRFPVTTANNLLQGKLADAGSDTGRFLVNTTVGVAGFIDVATDLGLPRHDEDMGQTLGSYGVPGGPYLVLPLFGPSNPRDVVGQIADSFLAVYPWFSPSLYTLPGTVVNLVNSRARALQAVEGARDASFDLYTAARNAYDQRRAVQINDGDSNLTREDEIDLYFPNNDSPNQRSQP